MIETYQLVTQTVNIAPKAPLARQNIFVVIDILVKEGTILHLVLSVINLRERGR